MMRHGNHGQLYKEATLIGASLVPMWYAVKSLTTAMNFGGKYKEMLDVAIAGALYHLTAEEIGLNAYYITNGHAYEQAFHTSYQNDDSYITLDNMDHSMVWLHSAGAVFGLGSQHSHAYSAHGSHYSGQGRGVQRPLRKY